MGIPTESYDLVESLGILGNPLSPFEIHRNHQEFEDFKAIPNHYLEFLRAPLIEALVKAW